MASLSIRCGGSNLNLRRLNLVNPNLRRLNLVNPNLRRMNHVNPSDQNARFSSQNISNHSRKQQRRISTTDTVAISTKSRLLNLQLPEKREENKNDSLGPEKMDRWIQESVNEIVQNLREAPLLVQVYSENNGKTTKVKTEKNADVKSWPIINRKWNEGESPSPEGVILVEELKDNEEDGDDFDSRAWGILIQGKGGELGSPVCYLLKTSRVRSGLGLCCTHFCLVRVKSFRETFASQITNSWLLQ